MRLLTFENRGIANGPHIYFGHPWALLKNGFTRSLFASVWMNWRWEKPGSSLLFTLNIRLDRLPFPEFTSPLCILNLWAFIFVSFFIYKILFSLIATVLQQHELFLELWYNWSGIQWRRIADISGIPVHHECSCSPPWREKKISCPLASRVVSHWWTDPDKITWIRSVLVKLKIHAEIT